MSRLTIPLFILKKSRENGSAFPRQHSL